MPKAKEIVAEKNEKISVRIPRIPGQKEQDDIILSVNGRTVQIQRGVDVELDRVFYEALQRMYANQQMAEDFEYSVANG